MTPWVTDDRIIEEIAGMVHKLPADLPDQWRGVISSANRSAVGDLVRILLEKGYTVAQVNQWDDRQRYNIDQAIYWTLPRLAGLGNYPDKMIDKFDRRKELKECGVIMIGGVATGPQTGDGQSPIGGISFGRNDKIEEDLDESLNW